MNNSFTIFYTDDDQDDQELFRDAVKEIHGDMKVFTQSNGAELIDQLSSASPVPNLIFLDLNMPIKNGYEVLKDLRKKDKLKYFPVVVLSTSNDQSAISTTRQLGASMYITKPNSFKNLKKAVQYSLGIDWNSFVPGDDNYVYKPE